MSAAFGIIGGKKLCKNLYKAFLFIHSGVIGAFVLGPVGRRLGQQQHVAVVGFSLASLGALGNQVALMLFLNIVF